MNNLKAIKRENSSAGQLNELRNKGFIPAILYGGKDPNTKISIDAWVLYMYGKNLVGKIIKKNSNNRRWSIRLR